MTLKNVKLIYFDARGRAEIVRLLLARGGVQYEDIRHTQDTWPSEKPNTPFGQVPVLEVDGKRYGQSVAIANFLAREFGLYGKSNLDGLKIDQVVQLGVDLWSASVKAFYEKDEAKKAEAFKNLTVVEIPKYLGFFEKLLKESGTGYFVGEDLTLADFYCYDIIWNFANRKILSTEGFPLLQGIINKVESNDKIKAYLATRKQTEN